MIRVQGFVLLEGLIAIVLFSIALLGLAMFQVGMIAQTTNVKYRLEASKLIGIAINEMEVDPVNRVKCYDERQDACGDAWRAQVNALPHQSTNLSVVTANGLITIRVSWLIPKDNQEHYVLGRYAPIKGIVP